MMDLGLVVVLGCCGGCVGSDVEVVVFGMVVSFLGCPWHLGSVMMEFSISGLWGAGAAEMTLLSMAPKYMESVWRSGSMLMEGFSVLMYMASSMPLFIQS